MPRKKKKMFIMLDFVLFQLINIKKRERENKIN